MQDPSQFRIAVGEFTKTSFLPNCPETALVGVQTAAQSSALMSSRTRASVSSQRVGNAMKDQMYIGIGTLVVIIVLILVLR
jgi:hypothetical protein